MKFAFIFLSLFFTTQLLAQAYVVKPNRWGENFVSFPGVSSDLFATHEFQSSRGPSWKSEAINYIEDNTDALEIFGKIEDGTISDHCGVSFDDIELIEAGSLSYKWRSLKALRPASNKTVLYVVETYGDYMIRLNSGRKVKCPYQINEYVFLNQPSAGAPFKFLGKTER